MLSKNQLIFIGLAGALLKLYDDFVDGNEIVSATWKQTHEYQFKVICEFLKIIHAMCFALISFFEPFFLYIVLLVVSFGYMGDRHAYEGEYESGGILAFFAFGILLPFISNSFKISLPSSLSQLFTLKNACYILLIALTLGGTYYEAKTVQEEVSVRKLLIRCGGTIGTWFVGNIFADDCLPIAIAYQYTCGYLLTSVLVQIKSILEDLTRNKFLKPVEPTEPVTCAEPDK